MRHCLSLFLLLTLMLVAGCATSPALPESVQDDGVDVDSSTPISATESPSTPQTAAPTDPPATPTPTAEISSAPTFSDQLRATDPATVKIGAGQPQLIEFFAFW